MAELCQKISKDSIQSARSRKLSSAAVSRGECADCPVLLCRVVNVLTVFARRQVTPPAARAIAIVPPSGNATPGALEENVNAPSSRSYSNAARSNKCALEPVRSRN